MLDADATPTQAADDLPRPPAGRRSSSRPAGPPAPMQAQALSATADGGPVAQPDASPAVEAPQSEAPQGGAPRGDAQQGDAQGEAQPARRPAARSPRKRIGKAAATDASRDPQPPARRRTRKAAAVAEPAPEAPADKEAADAAPAIGELEAPEVTPAVAAEPAQAGPVEDDAQPVEDATGGVEEDEDAEEAVDPEAGPAAGEAAGAERADTDSLASRLPAALSNPFAAPAVMAPGETDAVLADMARSIARDDDEPDADDSAEEPADESEDGQGRGRRRRRRGGRRRRKSVGESDSEADEQPDDAGDAAGAAEGEPGATADEEPATDAADPAEGDDAETDGEPESGEGRRRRRRRRRRGEDSGSVEDDVEVVDRVREPRGRRGKQASDEVTGIEGSTRLEAKRQRRREGRAAGRRRPPILSEAEFLSRRESVERVMAIRQQAEYTQIAVLEDKVLVEHYVDRASATSLIGNIYLGRVQNVLPSMEAAFIDIGRGRNAVLYAGEVDWDAYGAEGEHRKMEEVFKSGQAVVVQVTKDPVGAKGARLTSHISIPGRYIVYSPGGELSGISRKLPDTERARLKGILDGLIDEKSSVIVRTAAEGVAEEELVRDVNRLTAQWEAIQKKTKGSAPALLYAEPDATVRIVRDLFTEDFAKLVVDGNGSADDAYDTISAYVTHVAPHLADRLEQWDRERGDIFADYRIDEQIAKALERKVFLPSGGSLIIDRTEAMTVIDVNTGKFTGRGGNLEATVTSNNLEAAEEIVRQLRLRDIGGIVVIDFIDMVLPANRELLLRRLVECLGRDRTRHQVSEVTSLGLVQLTRKKIGTGLAEAFTEPCEACKGRGYHRHEEPVDTQAPADGGERATKRRQPARGGRRKTDGRSGGKSDGGDAGAGE